MKAVLEQCPGNLSLTVDGWSSRVYKGYVYVTVHWIDYKWEFHSAVLQLARLSVLIREMQHVICYMT